MSVIALKAFQDNYIWIIQQTSSFICVDPGDSAPVLAFSEQQQLDLKAILITHEHADHIGGVEALLEHFPNALLYEPKNHTKKITLSPYTFEVLNTPGHTDNHICYLEPNQSWLFCGDTLFSAGCGRVFSGSIEALFTSLEKLKTLNENTQVFCTHEYTRKNLEFAQIIEPNNKAIQQHRALLEKSPEQISLPSTIGFEKKINPFLRLDAPEVKAFVLRKDKHATTPLARFACLREEKDHF